jgi:hypothetical protein
MTTDITQPTTKTNDPAAKLPEKFRDPKTGEVRLDALINSYLELEKELSSSIPAPDTPEGKARLRAVTGVPETPDGYQIDVSHGLFTVDPEVNACMHEQGFTPGQAQTVYDLAAKKLVPAVQEVAHQFQADREVERLAAAFGGPEKWAEVSRQLLAWGQKNLPPQALASLSNSFEGVMALYRMMKAQEPGISVRADAQPSTPANEADLRAQMRDPRYWREKDPAFVAKVTDGFQRLYGQ